MNPFAKNGLAIITGIVAGSAINFGIIMISGYIIPPPAGVDLTSMESLSASMHLFEPKNFIMPFFANAGGTFAGAWFAARLSASKSIRYALLIGIFFMAGGIINACSLPSSLVEHNRFNFCIHTHSLAGRKISRNETGIISLVNNTYPFRF